MSDRVRLFFGFCQILSGCVGFRSILLGSVRFQEILQDSVESGRIIIVGFCRIEISSPVGLFRMVRSDSIGCLSDCLRMVLWILSNYVGLSVGFCRILCDTVGFCGTLSDSVKLRCQRAAPLNVNCRAAARLNTCDVNFSLNANLK